MYGYIALPDTLANQCMRTLGNFWSFRVNVWLHCSPRHSGEPMYAYIGLKKRPFSVLPFTIFSLFIINCSLFICSTAPCCAGHAAALSGEWQGLIRRGSMVILNIRRLEMLVPKGSHMCTGVRPKEWRDLDSNRTLRPGSVGRQRLISRSLKTCKCQHKGQPSISLQRTG